MTQHFTTSFGKLFAKEFGNFTESDQDKVLDFTEQFERCGLRDFSCYQGKISASWSNLDETDANYIYAKDNDLWHYHVGLPEYVQRHPKYYTSDWVVHFQWVERGNHIHLVDMCYHYTYDGQFYLPKPEYLEKAS
ncbi:MULTISPECIES: hypothetical protein [Klebsiella pneumoniae complex]|uniref:hypothetical protein n=1 Tax=Klebsiella pneumoniae complex TaxID=3390273 RepID=UPI000E2D7443|nr:MULTISPECIES: hypothetical protein [Klebsiella]HCB0667865.1 hypothetical protein [Klebsiella variicola subsp. variicola]HDS8940646.1 hypothetical protein [Klebsiella pneumoniae subsp. ozaenae]EKZ5346488.1 hypothetical protein [Klebsiella pneumoniae]ELA7639555.1 hypothetical protein [Klebsiella pneumoniae]ELB3540836.1 hypothetical protein [Klebsiella pneumoniae]